MVRTRCHIESRGPLDTVIVCHTEFGYATNEVIFDNDYKQGATDGVQNSMLISDRFGAIVSFMMKPEVLESVSGLDFGNHEVGLHIHPDDRYLVKQGVGGDDDNLRGYDFERQRDMIAVGKEAVRTVLGVVPRTFVAGKWSIGNETLRALVELGFSHDASGCPQFSSRSCDWGKLPRICMPYTPSRDDYQAAGDVQITMVPASKEITTGLINPENNAGLAFLRAAVCEYVESEAPLLHIAYHSPALTSASYRTTFSDLLQIISGFNAKFRPLSEVESIKGSILSYPAHLSQYMRNLDVTGLSYIMRHSISHPRSAFVKLRHL